MSRERRNRYPFEPKERFNGDRTVGRSYRVINCLTLGEGPVARQYIEAKTEEEKALKIPDGTPQEQALEKLEAEKPLKLPGNATREQLLEVYDEWGRPPPPNL